MKDPVAKHCTNLAQYLHQICTKKEMALLLEDLCTPGELQALNERLEILKCLDAGNTYREVSEKLNVSTTTVTRVARTLAHGKGGYNILLSRLKTEKDKDPEQ